VSGVESGGGGIDIAFRAGVMHCVTQTVVDNINFDGLPSHIPDRRKAIALRIPCFAQARGAHPCTPARHMCRTRGHPFDACVSYPAANTCVELKAARQATLFDTAPPRVRVVHDLGNSNNWKMRKL
jgi:hypothetical protein